MLSKLVTKRLQSSKLNQLTQSITSVRPLGYVPSDEPSFYEMVEIFFDRSAKIVEQKLLEDIKSNYRPSLRGILGPSFMYFMHTKYF